MSGTPADYWSTLPLGRSVGLLVRDANGLAAFNKPAGVLSHPNEPKEEPRALLTCRYDQAAQCFIWKTPAGTEGRLWLLNRLDAATSGVILVAVNEKLAVAIREQFAKKQVKKIYAAVVFGKPLQEVQLWQDLLAVQKQGGRVRTAARGNIPATTEVRLIRNRQAAFHTSLVQLEPHTGRSHQLRVQCAKRHLPIVGDQTYGNFGLNRQFAKTTGTKRLFLHSLETAFTYTLGGKKFAFQAHAPLPVEFEAVY